MSPMPTTPAGSNADEAMASPVLGGREARRLEWTVDSEIHSIVGRTRENVHRLYAAYGAGLLAGQFGLETARGFSYFLYKGTLQAPLRVSNWCERDGCRDLRNSIHF